MIKKTKKGYRVVSKSGKNLGDVKTKAAAKKRLKQVEMFKHMDKNRKKSKKGYG
jgi:hypothetical protein